MTLITGLTAIRMLAIEAASVVSGTITGDNLILTRQSGTTINAGNVRGPKGDPGVGRNRVMNGDFSVNQRAFVSSTATGTYGFDRWAVICSGGTTTHSAQAPTLGTLPESAKANVRLVTSGHSIAGDLCYLTQRMEGVRTLSGKTVTVSFWAKASTGTPMTSIALIDPCS